MLGKLRSVLSRLSVWLNEKNGGEPGKTLCWQWATDRHPYCLPCIIIGIVVLDIKHCFREINED
jgi:hypothetical protein